MIELKDLGATIDKLYALREDRLDQERKIKKMKEEEENFRAQILEALENSGLEKASGGLATCGIKRSTVPLVTDWEMFHAWIRENNRFDLLQKRIAVVAWREMMEDGKLIVGTEAMSDVDITLTRSSRS